MVVHDYDADHASLDPAEYRSLLDRNGFRVVSHVAEDPTCGGHTIWLVGASCLLLGIIGFSLVNLGISRGVSQELALAPYHRPGDSPWPDRYASWSVASSRV